MENELSYTLKHNIDDYDIKVSVSDNFVKYYENETKTLLKNETKTLLKCGNVTIQLNKTFNWFQKRMWKMFFWNRN